MSALPEPVVAAIVRGMSAYMQGANRTDLPGPLRPLQGKHLKMLTARKADIVAALDDEGLRAMLVDWLGDKPVGISKADATILEAAARRADGWVDELAGSAPARTPAALQAKDPSVALERAKERSRKARDDARRARQEAARSVAEERRTVAALRTEVAALSAERKALEKQLSATEKERDAALGEMEREVRKARRRAEKAEDALDTATTAARELRAELTRATSATPTTTPKKKHAASPPAAPEPARRKRLAVPKGRLGEDPATLTEWLSTPDVVLLVDGYNVSKAEGGFGDLRLETQRDRLLQEVGRVARRHKVTATVIFDGSEIPPGTSRRARGPVEVEYSRPDEIADDHLIAKLEGLPKHPVVVATNDKELQHRAARLGATIATSNQLLALIR